MAQKQGEAATLCVSTRGRVALSAGMHVCVPEARELPPMAQN